MSEIKKQNNTCSHLDCTREKFENSEECILHCKKNDWFSENSNGKKIWDENKVREFWKEIRTKINEKEDEICFFNMIFPASENSLRTKNNIMLIDIDFTKALHIYKNLYFFNCIFEDELIFFCYHEINGLCFEECNIKEGITFQHCSINSFLLFEKKSKINSIIFEYVTLLDDLLFENVNIGELNFSDSTFEKKLEFNNIEFKENINIEDSVFKGEVKFNAVTTNNEIKFVETSFLSHTSFMHSINDKLINKLVFENTEFGDKSDISFENVKIYYLSFNKVENYSDDISFFDTKILKELEFNNINLSNAEFHNCNFEKIKEKKIQIQNVSFISNNGFTIFNGVKWCKINRINANRDTFRQLKYVNEQQGNIIEANKFYSAEMEAYKKEIKEDTISESAKDKFVFGINYLISDFSRDWILPLIWYFVFGFLFSYCYYFDISIINNQGIISSLFVVMSVLFFVHDFKKYNSFRKTLYILFITSGLNYFMNITQKSLEKLFLFINPLNTSGLEGNDARLIWWILFRIISVFIIYQFIVSLRRQTRR